MNYLGGLIFPTGAKIGLLPPRVCPLGPLVSVPCVAGPG